MREMKPPYKGVSNPQCVCLHGWQVHRGRCRVAYCECSEFEPVAKGSIIAALDSRLSKPKPRDWTWR